MLDTYAGSTSLLLEAGLMTGKSLGVLGERSGLVTGSHGRSNFHGFHSGWAIYTLTSRAPASSFPACIPTSIRHSDGVGLSLCSSHPHFSMAGETEHCLIYLLAISILSLRTAGFTLLIYWVVAF